MYVIYLHISLVIINGKWAVYRGDKWANANWRVDYSYDDTTIERQKDWFDNTYNNDSQTDVYIDNNFLYFYPIKMKRFLILFHNFYNNIVIYELICCLFISHIVLSYQLLWCY